MCSGEVITSAFDKVVVQVVKLLNVCSTNSKFLISYLRCWDERSIVRMSICQSVSLSVCHTRDLQPIENILVSLESPKILVSEKVNFGPDFST